MGLRISYFLCGQIDFAAHNDSYGICPVIVLYAHFLAKSRGEEELCDQAIDVSHKLDIFTSNFRFQNHSDDYIACVLVVLRVLLVRNFSAKESHALQARLIFLVHQHIARDETMVF